jgi:hypothetical protein
MASRDLRLAQSAYEQKDPGLSLLAHNAVISSGEGHAQILPRLWLKCSRQGLLTAAVLLALLWPVQLQQWVWSVTAAVAVSMLSKEWEFRRHRMALLLREQQREFW